MIKILNSNSRNFKSKLNKILSNRKSKILSDRVSVSSIIKDVKKNGDKALLKYEKKYNKNSNIAPTINQVSKLIKTLDKNVKLAIDKAYNRIYKFHSLQKFKNISYTDKLKNKIDYKYLPLKSVAIYVPGSTVSYPSSVLMNAIPAIVAGVRELLWLILVIKENKIQQFYMRLKNVKLKRFTLLEDLHYCSCSLRNKNN